MSLTSISLFAWAESTVPIRGNGTLCKALKVERSTNCFCSTFSEMLFQSLESFQYYRKKEEEERTPELLYNKSRGIILAKCK